MSSDNNDRKQKIKELMRQKKKNSDSNSDQDEEDHLEERDVAKDTNIN